MTEEDDNNTVLGRIVDPMRMEEMLMHEPVSAYDYIELAMTAEVLMETFYVTLDQALKMIELIDKRAHR